MRFANPEYFYLLILIPLLIAVYIYSNFVRRRNLKEYGDEELMKELMPDASAYRPNVKFWLSLVAAALLVVVLARPQFGSKMETVTRQGIETVIALDISNSMLAEDIAPNRLEKSKKIISKLIDKFENDKIGLIVFAGDAFVQLPITNDFISAKMFMESISPSLISRQGTDIGAAINLAMKSFTPDKEVGKAVIVITDGENHEGGAEEAAKVAAESGISVYILGVGSLEGAPIPAEGNNDYRRDKDGNVIVTKLNEEMGQNIAKAGNGAYIRVDNTNNAQRLLEKEIDKLAKADVSSEVYTDYDEQFHLVAWIVLLLLVIDILILPGKSRFTRNFNLFGDK
ncbi:MAG: VWA domain-containing protein [Bacteroidaceae bacterium]|nr:VWA domain-containing protein [Bacteroidaceae bacterium]